MSQDKIIRSWNDLPEQDRSAALKDDIVFASLKSAYSDADFSERDKLLQRYAIELKCSYCDGIITANFLKGIPEVCPFCKRKSDGLVLLQYRDGKKEAISAAGIVRIEEWV